MAHILIDGYNLIGIAHKDLEKARQGLIQKLHEYSGTKGHDITLVFDQSVAEVSRPMRTAFATMTRRMAFWKRRLAATRRHREIMELW